jgi:hypothetical protein
MKVFIIISSVAELELHYFNGTRAQTRCGSGSDGFKLDVQQVPVLFCF